MKVAVINKWNPYFSQGASSNRWVSLLDGLLNKRVQIDLFCYGGYQNKEEKVLHMATHTQGLIFFYVTRFVFDTLQKRRILNYILEPLLVKRLLTALIREHNEKKYDILWISHGIVEYDIALYFRNISSTIAIFAELSEFMDVYRYQNNSILYSRKAKKLHLLFEREILSSLNGIAYMTKTLLNYYQAQTVISPRCQHLPMTVDLSRFENDTARIKEFILPYIAFVGVMNDAKDGVSILISAFNKIKSKYPNYKLYLVGAWNYDTPVHLRLIKEKKLEERVFWMKEYHRDQIPRIICNADLLVLPRPDSKQAQGGFPTKLGEYLATGNPVCATTVGEIPDYLVDNESVFFADPGSVESLAEAMDRALCDPENAKRVGLNGRRVAEECFNKDIQAKILYDFLKSL